jgi:VanZ family protein
MAVIFFASTIPAKEFPAYEGVWDFVVKKTGHLLEYGLLAILLQRGFAAQARGSRGSSDDLPAWAQTAATLALATLYGATDEFHQRFTPGRMGQAADVAIDFVGACLGLALLYGGRSIRRTRSRNPRSRSTHPPA